MNRILWPIVFTGAVIAVVGGVFMLPWNRPAESHANNDKFADPNGKGGDKDQPKGEKFAEDRKGEAVKNVVKGVEIDAKRAMGYLNDLCKIGPRISGTEGMKKQQELLEKHFDKLGGKITWQKFDGKQPSRREAVPMANMIISWNPDAKRRVILCGHYDTRPIADQEVRRADWTKPFISANDGTSTVALLMELAHHMKDLPRKVGVDFVIFDGEEFIHDSKLDSFFLGSNIFADVYKKDKQREYKYIAAVLMDLFAGKNATYGVEGYSRFGAGPLLKEIWDEAERQGVKSFVWEDAGSVQDDHLALLKVEIPAIDIIDFSYAHWHKLTDLPENCSGEAMANVAKVLTAWIQGAK
jgi:hypothetical protein